MGALRKATHVAVRLWWVGALVAAVLVAVLVELRAQLAPSDQAQVLAADQSLSDAMRAGDKSAARRLLSLEFSFVDQNGEVHARKDFLAALKGFAFARASDAAVRIYGLVATITGHRQSAAGGEVFFLDIWVKQKRSWRALVMQDVVLGSAAPGSEPPPADAKDQTCANPCQTIPYRVRSAAEQDVVTAFQAIERAAVAHDAEEWGKHAAEEFVDYRSGSPPMPRAKRIARIAEQKDGNIPTVPPAVEFMRLWVFGDGAAMITTEGAEEAPLLSRTARVWVKRNDQWQIAVGVRTLVK